MYKRFAISLFASASLFLTACNGSDGKDGTNGSNGNNGSDGIPALVTAEDVLRSNANMAYAAYSDSLVSAISLDAALSRLVANPAQETLDAAKTAWLQAREPYGQTEVYRFRVGPIDALGDDAVMGEEGDGPEGRINAWPLGEAIIDYVANQVDGDEGPENAASTGAITGNIIADSSSFPTIDKDTLSANFELGGDERNVTTGYHAIEFLLWGQDLNLDGSGSGARDSSGGQRPFSDYDMSAGNCSSGDVSAAESICQRRGEFLLATSELLMEDLARIVEAWNPSVADNHYASFVAGGNTSMAKILEGMGRMSFGELAGERMNIALLQDSQEDEHSCFSDNTHRDIFLNAKGVQNAFTGDYQRIDGSVVSGAGIDDYLISQGEVSLENQLAAALEFTMIKLAVIDHEAKSGMPFDTQIQDAAARLQIAAGISALSAQTDFIEDVIQALNLTTGDLRQDTDEDI